MTYVRSPDTTASPIPARRCSCWDPVSAAETANLRCSSAITGRTAERFCFSECTSPSSRSNSSQPIHIPPPSRRRCCGGGLRFTEIEEEIGGLAGQLPLVVNGGELHRKGEPA